jgi:lipopolysaccharide/colanic/teichoic acid biosynthesis glycosyltransferase
MAELSRLPADRAFDAGAPTLRQGRAYEATKRAIDVVVSGLALLVLSPLLLTIGLGVRVSSRGPALFRQTRVGKGRQPFRLYKFRTMYRDNDDSEHRAFVTGMLEGTIVANGDGSSLYKLSNDPRITRIGAWLRRTSLDELPQLWNVLRGDMSLVGPRPVLPWESEMFEAHHQIRFEVRPGITGLWQVSGRNLLTMNQGLDLDAEYVRRRSLRLDLSVLVRTLPQVAMRRGAG